MFYGLMEGFRRYVKHLVGLNEGLKGLEEGMGLIIGDKEAL